MYHFIFTLYLFKKKLKIKEFYLFAVPFIDPCHYDDSDCILKSAKKAMPHLVDGYSELDIPSFNPLVMHNIKGDNGEFKLEFLDIAISEIPNCEIAKIK